MQRPQNEYRDQERKATTKHRFSLVKITCWALIGVGAASLGISIIIVSQTLALIGLGLIFWGAILLYIQPEEYAKKVLLDAAMPVSFETLYQIINELGYRGKSIYLPPKYLRDPGTNKVYLPKRPEEMLPDPNLILKHENQIFLNNPEAILFTPPGAQLTGLFEKRLGISFTQADPQYLKQNLPKLLIEDLEIAEDLEIEIKPSEFSTGKIGTNYGTAHVRITNSIFKNMLKENAKLSQICGTIGTPISNAIACALTKVTGRPLIIGDIRSYEDGNVIEVTYKIENLEYKEQPEAPLTEIPEYTERPEPLLTDTLKAVVQTPLFPRLIGLSLMILGFLTLVWISQLTWHEMNTWHKDLGFSLFTYRTGEPIGLGIGMKVIYYFMIGSALLLSGTLAYLRKGKKIIEAVVRTPLFPRLVGLSIIVLGAFTIVWISELVCYETIVWHKNFIFILFAYGAGESIGLGIGMKVIYYFMIGSALLLSGTLAYLRTNKNLTEQ
jgi:hypothetical protein